MLDRQTSCSLRIAMEARDLPGIVEAFTENAEFRSPLTNRLSFKGHEQIGALARVILDVFEDFRYTDEVIGAETGFLTAQARIGGQAIEMVDHLRFGADGRTQECTVFFRPLPAAAVALRMIGTALGRRKSTTRAATISVLSNPLAVMARLGDGIGVRLIRGAI